MQTGALQQGRTLRLMSKVICERASHDVVDIPEPIPAVRPTRCCLCVKSAFYFYVKSVFERCRPIEPQLTDFNLVFRFRLTNVALAWLRDLTVGLAGRQRRWNLT